MGEAILYFGISQSLFAAVLMFIKRPLNIADKILGIWLLTFSIMFAFNLFKLDTGVVDRGVWPIFVTISITFPSFLYLYSKYITNDYRSFIKTDYLHFLPTLAGFIISALAYDSKINSIQSFSDHYSQKTISMAIVAFILFACILFYATKAHIFIQRYRKQIRNFYSFKSYRINLNWLRVILFSFITLHYLIIPISRFYQHIPFNFNLDNFRNLAYLIFVYIISLWGFKQKQLITDPLPKQITPKTEKEDEEKSNRYKKSGLKDDQADHHLEKLIDYMNTSLVWKDPELSLAKISEDIEIPKHFISQVLNEKLKKNFYTFVNEYRTEYAKQLMVMPQYKNWTIISIAFECGFNSKTAFNIFFKKHTNMTPTEYKKKHAGE